MVYYSPYKKIIRAFIRAIRTFIFSLFSKRLLLMIIIALIIMLLHINVHASEITFDDYIYREVSEPVYDNETDSYLINYRVYNSSGEFEGSTYIPSSIFNTNCWLLFIDENGILRILQRTSGVSSNLYLKSFDGTSYIYYSWNGNRKISDSTFYQFDTANNNWTTIWSDTSSNSRNFRTIDYFIPPSSIIYSKNINFLYAKENLNTTFPVNYWFDNLTLRRPELYYVVDSGFRLYLNDFHGSLSSYGPYEASGFYIENDIHIDTLLLSVYDINNDEYLINRYNLLSYDDVHEDENGKYYIDLLFSDLLSSLQNEGDYLLGFGIILRSDRYNSSLYTTYFNNITRYVSYDFFRFKWFGGSNVGLLVPVYEDLTPKPGYEVVEPGTEPGDNEHQTINAINNLNNTINNQTTIIQEQTNTINDMSNFMQDDSYSSDSITDNMPNNDEFQDVTENGFDNIFTTLKNAFTSDNYQDVVFTVPFSNGQTITLPSNLTENIIPTAIKTLIQMVYWYFIARFIVKDIANYIEKAKSGDIFTSSDTNIKTDML